MLRNATYSQGCMLDWGANHDMTVDMTSNVASSGGGVTPSSCWLACAQAGYSYGATQVSSHVVQL